jgi:hypothetical protein
VTPRMHRGGVFLVALAISAVLGAAPASGHGLLQVDVLRRQDVFVPQWAIGGTYALDPKLRGILTKRLKTLRASDAPVKIVLIAQRTDLEDAAMYFEHPVAYASFLEELLSSQGVYDGRLIVVMPNGSADVLGAGRAHALEFRPMMKSQWDADALARTAIRAIAGVTASNGDGISSKRLELDWLPAWRFAIGTLLVFALLVAHWSRRVRRRLALLDQKSGSPGKNSTHDDVSLS